MKKLILFLLCFCGQLLPQNFSNGFNFNLPWNDSTTQQFLPAFPVLKINDFIKINSSGNFSVNGSTIRFWGTNFVADGAFPEKSKAPAVAGRYRKMGFNLVRMHHIDNPWSEGSLFDQWDDTRNFNPVTLDKLEYLIHNLKENGIYVNMNLNVSRTFKNIDGVENADSLVDFAKGVTIFDPVMITLQKEYAQKLLTHVNPYTGKALVDDPVMAMVEIINENSLYRMWREDKLKSFGDGTGKLIQRHTRMLDSMYNSFLITKYSSTDNLAASWGRENSQGSGVNQIINGDFENISDISSWVIESQSGAEGQQTKDIINPYSGKASAKVTVTKVTGTSWHLQWKQVRLKLTKDSSYTVEFAAKAEGPRTITVTVMAESSPWTWYAGKEFSISDSWKIYSFSFKAPENNNNTRLSFAFNNTVGNYWFDNIKMVPAVKKGLAEEESLELRTVKRIGYGDCVCYSDARAADQSAFYIKLQDDFFADMKNYLVNTLGVKVPVVGTNWNIGPGDLISQSEMDYLDNHAYWDHPNFPGVPWSSTDWYISNQSMVTAKTGMSIADIFAGTAHLRKPYTVSEINSCFPNRYQTESLIFITAYSALHNTDGIMFFEYNGSSDWTSDRISGYFALHRNPAMMSLMPACAFAFRNNLISPARETIKINYTRDFVNLLPKYATTSWVPELFPKKLALVHGIRNESFNSTAVTDFSVLQEPVNPYKSDTDEILWDNKGIVSVNTSRFIGIAGFLQNFPGRSVGSLKLLSSDEFAVLTWLSLSGDSLSVSDKSLVTISTAAQNSGMIWEGTTTFHNNWGSSPTQMKPAVIKTVLTLYADSVIVYPLDFQGSIKSTLARKYYPSVENRFEITFDLGASKSLWFGIEKFGNGTLTSVKDEVKRTDEFRLEQNYPNPFNAETTFRYSLPFRSKIRLSVYDVLGKEIAVLQDGIREKGNYSISWNGRNSSDTSASSGIFFIRLVTEQYTGVRKVVMLK